MDSTITITMENALRAAISAAFKTLDGKVYPQEGPKDMLDMVLDDVFVALFPRSAPVEREFLTLPASPISERGQKRKADEISGSEKKKKTPKARLVEVNEPNTEAEAQEPMLEKKKRAPKVKPVVEESSSSAAAVQPEKKKRAPKAKPADPSLEQLTQAMSGLTVAEPAPEPEKKKPRKKKEPTPGDVEKLNPTESRKLKEIGEELKVEADKKEFIAYLNTMTAEERGVSKFEVHIRNFLNPKVTEPVAVEAAVEEISGLEVTFDGEDLIVDPDTKRVYKSGLYVGDVGKLKYKDLEIPEYED